MLILRVLFGAILLQSLLMMSEVVCAFTGTASDATAILTTVNANCHVNNAVMSFGEYDPITKNATAPLQGLTSFQIACTKGASAAISLSDGNNANHAQGASRAMTAGGPNKDYLSYDLYINSSYSTVWNATNVIQYIANNRNTNTIAVYGSIPGGQNVGSGYFSDSVDIVANF